MNKLSRDLFFSTLFSVLNVIFNMWLVKNAEYSLSIISFGTFLLIRRIAASFSNLSQLGASQGIIRFGSININDEFKKRNYFLISFLAWFVSLLILFVIYYLLNDFVSKYTFKGIPNSKQFLFYTFWYIAVLHLAYLVQPFFLIQRKIILFNIISTLNGSLIFLFVFLFFNTNVDLLFVLRYSLISMSVLEIVLMVYVIFKLKVYLLPSIEIFLSELKQFYLYSIPRSGITFLDMFLLTIGVLIVPNNSDSIAAFLSTIVLARMILVVLQPISLLSSVIIGTNQTREKQKQAVNIMTGAILYFTVIFLVLFVNWIDVLISFWLSKEHNIINILFAFKIVAIGLIPYALFNGLKGIIEVRFFKPYNLYSLIIAITVHIALFFVFNRFYDVLTSLSLSITISFIIMGILSVFWCRKDYNNIVYFRIEILSGIGLFLFAVNFYIKTTYPNILTMIVSVAVSGVLYLAVVYYAKIPFVKDTLSALLNKNKI